MLNIASIINSETYQKLKAITRSSAPIPDNAKRTISRTIGRLHREHVQNFVFIHINKCGGTSMERALGIPFLNHDTAQEVYAYLGEDRWLARYRFTVVRNPYDRLASLYFYRNRLSNDSVAELSRGFPQLVESVAESLSAKTAGKMIQPQINWVTDSNGQLMINEFFRIEEISQAIPHLEMKLNKSINLKRLNSNPRPVKYRSLYTKDIASIVTDIYSEDFERFGYDLNYDAN